MKIKLLSFSVFLLALIGPSCSQEQKDGELEGKILLHAPVNSKASPEARNLLNYIYSLSGKKLLSGQHDFNNLSCSKEVYEITGKYPAILGIELNVYLTDSLLAYKVRDSLMQKAVQYWKDGGIITATWHQCKPGSPVQNFANSQAKCTQEEFDEFITPGSAGYKCLINEFDQVASHFKKLQMENVPVLWRPFHEMNGGWFWWGKKFNFGKLWDIMSERFTNYHKLNNLIWVYGPNVPINNNIGPYKNYYPGHSKADILGTDAYPKENNLFLKEWHDEIVALAEGRPVAQTECGVLPTTEQFSGIYGQYTWFLAWRGYLTKSNTIEQIQKLYNDPRTITRDEVPDLKVKY